VTRRGWLSLAAGAAVAADRKNRAPVSREPLIVKFPEGDAVKLANGVTLVVVEDNRLPIATIFFRVEGAGPIYSAQPGVAEMTAEMLREGAGGRTGRQIVEEAARLGATIQATAQQGAETAGLDGVGLAGRWPEWFSLLGSLILQPTFPADDFTALRQRWLVNRPARARQAAIAAEDALTRVTYGSHPAGALMPAPESLAALTPERLAAFHRERYIPENTVVLAVGRLRTAAFRSEAEKTLGAWKGGNFKPQLPSPPQPPATRRVLLIDRPGAAQTEFAIGGLLTDRRDPDYFPIQLANAILGGGATSRLSQSLCEEKGYGSAASSIVNTPRFTGFWRARASVRTDAAADSLAIMLDHLRRLCDEPVSPEELEHARRVVSGAFALQLEQPGNVGTLSYLRYRYGFSNDYWERYPAKLNSVSAAEVQAVAQKYFRPNRANIVAAGDGARIRPALAKYGNVETA
jgi:zinc protease